MPVAWSGARSFAKRLKLFHSYYRINDVKKRNECEVMNVIGDVQDKDTLLLDDMVDTSRHVDAAAKALTEQGARRFQPA